MTHAIKVIIVEREPLYRRGLVGCLEAGDRFEVVGGVDTAAAGYQLAEDASPDVALVGTTLATAPGLAFATELRRRYPAVAVIVVAADESDNQLIAAIRAGAVAYVGRDIGEEQLYELVRRSANGEYVINEQLLSKPYIAARVLDQFRAIVRADPTLTPTFVPLSERELEILGKVCDVNDRTQAVVTALRRVWLTIENQSDYNGGSSAGSTSLPTSRLGGQ